LVEHNPRYGEVAAYRDDNDAYIYGWGGAPTVVTDSIDSQYVYQIRVATSGAWDQTQYEYWWGREQGWQVNNPLSNFTAETELARAAPTGVPSTSATFTCTLRAPTVSLYQYY
jgi:hypothetical protein